MTSTSVRRRRMTAAGVVTGLALASSLAGGWAAADAASTSPLLVSSAAAPVVTSPEVVRSLSGPTGYEVTFRYYAPTATAVRIRGEWGLRSVADPTTRPPSQYQSGDFFNEALTSDMDLDPATGVWSYTTPLPPGTWSYQFLPTPSPASGLAVTQDPANPTFNQVGATTVGSYEALSQVYVPQEPAFSGDDRSVEAPPASPDLRGELANLRYASPGSTTCATIILCRSGVNEHDLAIYTPPGYDPERGTPYPTLYLSHGGGGNEIDWFTQGAAASILDNLINNRTLQPVVVVATDFNGMPSIGGSAEEGYAQDLINNVIPLVQSRYHVSTKANDRAFGGLSAGGGRGGRLLFQHPETFGYFGIWSSTDAFGPTIDMSNPAARTRLALHVGIGRQDPGVARHEGLARLATTNIPFTRDDVNGVHSWATWRQLLTIYASKIAFAHTTTSLTSQSTGLVAHVVPDTTEPAVPTGSVQFALNGKPLGEPVRLLDGTATLANPMTSGSVTATYSGDRFYATSSANGTVQAAAASRAHTRTKLTLRRNQVGVGTRATAVIKVRSADDVAGKVRVRIDGHKYKTVKLKRGHAAVLLPARLATGTHKIRVRYLGSSASAESTSRVVKLVVRARR